ncbi:MAG: AAA family ATPase, partial [Bacteroidales bacterium]|nr:AAA family ATPase [Bacteroidales bacterium]
MTKEEFIRQVNANFGHTPTNDQERCINDVVGYLADRQEKRVHIINGYAGSGKTSLVAAIVKTLYANNARTVLLAPTGRAAKVLSNYCNAPAYTIHKYIYNTFQDEYGNFKIILSKRQNPNTIYFIDEASMIADGTNYGENHYSERNLLEDIISFVLGKTGCKLIFIGDTAQLPPVGFTDSPALVPKTFTESYHIDASISTLTQVVRQIDDSPILTNATFIRNKLLNKDFSQPFFNTIEKGKFTGL